MDLRGFQQGEAVSGIIDIVRGILPPSASCRLAACRFGADSALKDVAVPGAHSRAHGWETTILAIVSRRARDCRDLKSGGLRCCA